MGSEDQVAALSGFAIDELCQGLVLQIIAVIQNVQTNLLSFGKGGSVVCQIDDGQRQFPVHDGLAKAGDALVNDGCAQDLMSLRQRVDGMTQ